MDFATNMDGTNIVNYYSYFDDPNLFYHHLNNIKNNNNNMNPKNNIL